MEDMEELWKLLQCGSGFVDLLGDCPNIPLKIIDHGIFWKDIRQEQGFRLQKNDLLGICRIVDDKNQRISWGGQAVMEEKFCRILGSEFLHPGDIVGISRGVYEHYAVYIGNGEVIHYSGAEKDIFSDVMVRQGTLEDFLKSDRNYFVLYFEDVRHAPKKIFRHSEWCSFDDVALNQMLYSPSGLALYSDQETVERAKSRLGERKYHLAENNCEHFAVWCKTGISSSFQVKRIAYHADRIMEEIEL